MERAKAPDSRLLISGVKEKSGHAPRVEAPTVESAGGNQTEEPASHPSDESMVANIRNVKSDSLFYVDNARIAVLLGRVLAIPKVWDKLADKEVMAVMADVNGHLDVGRDTRDVNPALVARCLIGLPPGKVLPLMPEADIALGQPVRAEGWMTSMREKNGTTIIRLESSRTRGRISAIIGPGHRLRLVASELRDQHLAVVGFVRSAKYSHIDVAAAMFTTSSIPERRE